jgi:glycosyltransferase involved in cell wall biosynthesis
MLALSPVPEEGAGCRFRIAQYVPALEAAGIDVTISPFYTREFFGLVYRKGGAIAKASLFVQRAIDRLRTVADRGRYDVVFIYREALPIGPAIVETLLAQAPGLGIIYDFDDAVFLPNTSEANRAIALLKWPRKVKSIIQRSDVVIAGNEFLAQYARRFTDSVRVIPTVVDTAKFVPRAETAQGLPGSPKPAGKGGSPAIAPVVGWIGTPTTVPYLRSLDAVLQEVARTHPFVLRVCGAGGDVKIPGVTVQNTPWTLDGEVALFNTCDIGVYPLSDDEWSRGKCGFKAIQFMACGVPVVAAPVGVNGEIITDGVDSLLASTPEEWVQHLRRLIADAGLRARLGAAGRQTIVARYSLSASAPILVQTVIDAVTRAHVGRRAVASGDSVR